MALEYTRRDWPVFPCRPRGKEPLTVNGFHAATTDADQVSAWWTEEPEANIGFCPGRAGLLVVDIDGPDGERDAQELGLLSEPTLTVITPRGQHLYFRHPGGRIGNRKLAICLDVRGDAGYVLLPPSIHPSGKRYRALGEAGDTIALPPAALAVLLPVRKEVPALPAAPPINAGTPQRSAYVVRAIELEALSVANAPEGSRNNRLNEAAFALARFIATGEAGIENVVGVLAFAARHAGLPEYEIERTIESAFGARGVEV